MTRVPVVPVALAALLTALVAVPRAQAVADRTVEGRVVADDTGDPIPNAKVGFATAAATRATLTDRDGRFVLAAPPRLARVTVAKAGYARRDVAVQPGRPNADIRLARTAVITGQVMDASGEPAANVVVRAEVPAPAGQAFSVVATRPPTIAANSD